MGHKKAVDVASMRCDKALSSHYSVIFAEVPRSALCAGLNAKGRCSEYSLNALISLALCPTGPSVSGRMTPSGGVAGPTMEPVMMKMSVLAALLATVAVSDAAASPFNLERDGPWVRTPKDREACSAQALAWCSEAAVEKVAYTDWTIEAVAGLQAKLTANFQYSYAVEMPWRSHFEAAAAGQRWVDDCDGLTFTMIDALARAGFPTDKLYRAIVSPQGNASSVAHMVGIVEVGGLYYVVGDSDHAEPYPLRQARFKPLLLSKVSEGSRWKRAALNSPLRARAE